MKLGSHNLNSAHSKCGRSVLTPEVMAVPPEVDESYASSGTMMASPMRWFHRTTVAYRYPQGPRDNNLCSFAKKSVLILHGCCPASKNYSNASSATGMAAPMHRSCAAAFVAPRAPPALAEPGPKTELRLVHGNHATRHCSEVGIR